MNSAELVHKSFVWNYALFLCNGWCPQCQGSPQKSSKFPTVAPMFTFVMEKKLKMNTNVMLVTESI